eukprot:CAMPEP_0198652586 /NCGR_PEP_ID=MMETSP1467-20131203/6491_1 /TAXON_ID=1462469 /ORGANISM="unid. sp., Strain CCMP2135" /LENGTH=78 /DNA_ID=CAMNT_0044388515 /DNA_START=77 /DNA_END=313 /DNA_ORIENTATION=-
MWPDREEYASPYLDLLLFVLVMPLFGIIIWAIVHAVDDFEKQDLAYAKEREAEEKERLAAKKAARAARAAARAKAKAT